MELLLVDPLVVVEEVEEDEEGGEKRPCEEEEGFIRDVPGVPGVCSKLRAEEFPFAEDIPALPPPVDNRMGGGVAIV